MGTITVNVSDETEFMFRKTVKEKLGEGKGKLGSALTEAMKKWAEEKKQKEIADRALKIVRKGIYIGFKGYKNRDELYDKKYFSD